MEGFENAVPYLLSKVQIFPSVDTDHAMANSGMIGNRVYVSFIHSKTRCIGHGLIGNFKT